MSAIATTIDAFVTALRGTADLAGVQIIDGPTTEALHNVTIEVGVRTEEIDPVAGTFTPAGLGSDTESFDLASQIMVYVGGTDVKPARDRAFALLATVRGVLTRDPMLGETVLRAALSSVAYEVAASSEGLMVGVLFSVRCEATHYLS